MQPYYLQLFTQALQTKDHQVRQSIIQKMNPTPEVTKSIHATVTSMPEDTKSIHATVTSMPEDTKSIHATVTSMPEDTNFIIEPNQEKLTILNQSNKIIYKTDFIYGFQTNDLFYSIPGDKSSTIPKECNELSKEIVFTFDPQTNQLLSIYESMAGNTFGKSKQNKISIGVILAIALAVIGIIVIAALIIAIVVAIIDAVAVATTT